MRGISYREAISEATVQIMERDGRVFVMGVGVADPKGTFGTTLDAFRKFGDQRVVDVPLAENSMTGVGIGAALAGMRPIMVHARNDFLLLAMDQIVNNAAKWRYMSGGRFSVPITIRAIIGRGWGQAAQHSQSLQALFAHIPGLKVVMPSTPYDAKGLLLASIQDDSPVIVLEHRWLYESVGPVPEDPYALAIGEGAVRKEGRDATVVAVSLMAIEAMKAAEILAKDGIHVEVIDLRTLRPLDEGIIVTSVAKTGRLVIADTGWRTGGVSAEIAARVAEAMGGKLKAPIRRVALPDVPTPCCSGLEQRYYPGPREIISAVKEVVSSPWPHPSGELEPASPPIPAPVELSSKEFKGPF